MKTYSFRQHLKESLKNPEFKRIWEKEEPEYRLTCQLIEARLAQKLSQNQLAKRAKTTQAVISRLEAMSFNPSIGLLQKIATALDRKLVFSLHTP